MKGRREKLVMTDEVLHEGQKCKNKISGTHIPWIAISMIMPAKLILFGGGWGCDLWPIVPVFS
jgi:hypothetical protein